MEAEALEATLRQTLMLLGCMYIFILILKEFRIWHK